MVMLVSLQHASDHLRRDGTDDDADLELKIKAASSAVVRYLKDQATVHLPTDSSGDWIVDSQEVVEDVPEDIRVATLLLIATFYADREGQSSPRWEAGYLPMPVMSLLIPYRDPEIQ